MVKSKLDLTGLDCLIQTLNLKKTWRYVALEYHEITNDNEVTHAEFHDYYVNDIWTWYFGCMRNFASGVFKFKVRRRKLCWETNTRKRRKKYSTETMNGKSLLLRWEWLGYVEKYVTSHTQRKKQLMNW